MLWQSLIKMRNAFVSKLTEIARENEKIVLLVGDIGFGVFENFKKEFPKRYFNLGIAEQNSVGVVSGLAKEGFFPIFYTIIPFLLYRPFEQIRNDLCINRRDALLVGVGAGLSYGALGPTHHALEDIGLMSTLPEMRIYTPSSPMMVGKSLNEALNSGSGPAYLRLGKNGESNLSFDDTALAKWEPIRTRNPNKKIFILSHGAISKFVEDAIDEINLPYLITFGVIEQIKPFPFDKLSEQAKGSELIITIEEHYGIGGLFDKVLSAVNKFNPKLRVENISVPHRFITEVGSQENLLEDLLLNTLNLEKRIRKAIQNG
jgi:transketolase